MKKILIIYGGISTEHDISIKSAKNVVKTLKDLKITFDEVYISKENKWYLIKNEEKREIQNIVDFLKDFDLVFPVMHGASGEDGKIQALFELFNIKYVGSDSKASMLAMDKHLTKTLIAETSINQIPYFILNKGETKRELDFPLIIKPANGGSSIGINVAHNQKEYLKHLKEAFKYDQKIVVEKFIKGIELECAIIEDKKAIVSDVGEIKYSHEFYDFKAKYEDKSEIIIPALIKNELKLMVQSQALEIFKKLNLHGLARLDFIYDSHADVLYFNEVNTIPGMTDSSMFPLLFKSKKLDFSKLMLKIIN